MSPMATIDIVLKTDIQVTRRRKLSEKLPMAFLTIDIVNISWGNVAASKLIVAIHTNNSSKGSDGGSHVHRSVSVSETM